MRAARTPSGKARRRLKLTRTLLAWGLLPPLIVLAEPSCQSAPPPYAEALLIVETDLPVPQLAGRLRVDLYAADGTWYSSRDIGRPDTSDWPVSFSVYSTDEANDTDVLVRLRLYPDGFVRDYLGEQYQNRNGPLPHAAGPTDTGPRLMENGVDVTPSSEPQPLVTVDRMVYLRLQPGVRGRVQVTLRGDCVGTMALLSQAPPYQTPAIAQAATCTDTENTLDFLTPAALDPDMSIPPATPLGTFAAGQPCDDKATDPRAQCIPGGVFILGDKSVVDLGPPYDGVPPRTFAMDRFWLDRNEVTVGQLRTAIAAGFYRGKTLPVGTHDGALGQPLATDEFPIDRWCTWSTSPTGREDYPLSCVAWDFARDYCQFEGGDLTTEAEWEYAGAAAGRPYKTDFPWGDTPLLCNDILYDRFAIDNHIPACGPPVGPEPITSTPRDRTPGGVVDMGGSQAELMKDTLAAYSDPCWMTQPLHNPWCNDPATTTHTLRGGSWGFAGDLLYLAVRNDSGSPEYRALFGFRCAFRSAPGHP